MVLRPLPRLLASEESQVDEKYYAALAENWELGRTRGIDAALQARQLDALILPTDSAWIFKHSYTYFFTQ